MADIHTTKGGAPPRRGAAAATVARFLAARQRSLLGLPEIVALAAAGLLLAAAVSSYFLLLRPQRARLERLAAEQASLERVLRGAQAEGLTQESTQASVERILTSLQEFESGHLGTPTHLSATEVAGELNQMILRHNLHISGGLDFTQFEGQGQAGGRQQRQQTGASRPVQTVFPGVGIQISVEGPYANLRRFIREVESQDERFIVINSVELEGVTDSRSRSRTPAAGPPGEAAATTPGTAAAPPPSRSSLVSLRLDMAAYFRRAAVAPAPDAAPPLAPVR